MNRVDAVQEQAALRPALALRHSQGQHTQTPGISLRRRWLSSWLSSRLPSRLPSWLSLRLSLGFVVLALGFLALPPPASAAPLAERDARAVRAVIEAQLESFTVGNAEGAFSHASAAIRTQFGDAANFMAMVRTAYPMLVQPAATSFFVPEWAEGAVLQKVQLRDRAGRSWLATYQLLRQPDATWRINGCAVLPDSGKSST